jgi:hypothetical protein
MARGKTKAQLRAEQLEAIAKETVARGFLVVGPPLVSHVRRPLSAQLRFTEEVPDGDS